MKSELVRGYPAGRLFRDSLATALAASLLQGHSNAATKTCAIAHGHIGARKLSTLLAFIEDNLDKRLTLAEIARVAGVGTSQCKMLFRNAMGVPLHQYVIQRRVERARSLLYETDLPLSEVALQTGFSHQSHLALHMKRMLGHTPGELTRRITNGHDLSVSIRTD